VLAHGFARVRCTTFHKEIVVAFSCKRRSSCRSWQARRRASSPTTWATSSSSFGRHVVVAEFWATWCKPCAITMPRLDQWQTKYAAQGLVVLGISDEEPDNIRRYATDHAIGYTLVRDTGGKVAARYLRMGVPLLVVIDKRGVVRYAGMGAGDLDRVESIVDAALRE
jgi:thiol-disulfide isomerase/thioredoxin